MAIPQIIYNGRTISFPEKVYDIQTDYPGGIVGAGSASNIVSILNVAPDVYVRIAARNFENAITASATFKRNLYQWFEWARQGFAWQLALYDTKTSSTTISAGAAAGASSVIVTSATGLVAGDQCILKSATQQELVKISSMAGTTANLTETLLFSYASGSRFRHETYWPARLGDYSNLMGLSKYTTARKHPVQEKPPLHFDVEIILMEDMN